MPTRTETRTLGEEVERVDAKLSEFAETVVANGGLETINEQAKALDEGLAELESLRDEYGADAEVTVRGLDEIKMSEVGNLALDARDRASTQSVEKTEELIRAAKALVDAPWLVDVDTDDTEAVIEATFEGRKGLRYWLLQLENDLSGYEERDTKNWHERIAVAASSP